MDDFQIVVMVNGTTTDAELPDVEKDINAVYEKQGVSIRKTFSLGRRKFAYPIKHQTSGTYLVYHMQMKPESVKTVSEAFRLHPSIVRHLILKEKVLTEEQEAAKKALQEKLRTKHLAKELEKRKEQVASERVGGEKISKEELGKKIDTLLDSGVINE